MFCEFKEFIAKGNVLDLAVAVIIGGAFGKVVDSLVKDIIMPLLAFVIPSKGGYAEWAFRTGARTLADGTTVYDKMVPYGKFLGEVVNFLIVAFAVFIVIVKVLGFIMKMKRKQEAAAPPPPPAQEVLLTEIRDLLKKQVEKQ